MSQLHGPVFHPSLALVVVVKPIAGLVIPNEELGALDALPFFTHEFDIGAVPGVVRHSNNEKRGGIG